MKDIYGAFLRSILYIIIGSLGFIMTKEHPLLGYFIIGFAGYRLGWHIGWLFDVNRSVKFFEVIWIEKLLRALKNKKE